MRQSVRDIWTEFNAPLEDRLPFMYLDIKGLVTTGLGNLIDATGPPPLRPPTDSERAASHELARQLAWQANDRDQQLFRNAAAVIVQGLDPDALVWSSTA